LVERVLAKHEVVGSKPITRSMYFVYRFKPLIFKLTVAFDSCAMMITL
jgi:hypothetical protein